MAGEGSKIELAYGEQTALGTAFSGTGKKLRRVSDSLDYAVTTTRSQEIVDTREIADDVRVDASVAGGIVAEIPYGAHDDLLLAALQANSTGALGSGAWPSEVTDGPTDTISFATGPNTITTDDVFTGINAGDWILVAGSTQAANNGWTKVISKSGGGDVLTVSKTLTAVNESPGAVTIKAGSTLTNGTLLRYYGFERLHRDAAGSGSHLTDLFQDCCINGLGWSATPGSIMQMTFDIIGGSMTLGTSEAWTTSYTTPGSGNSVLNTVSNVAVYLGSTLQTGSTGVGATSASLQITNNLRGRTSLGVQGFSSIANGTLDVSGALSLYMASNTERQRFIDNGTTDLAILLDGPDGAYMISCPRIRYRSAPRNASGINTDTILDLNFGALKGTGDTAYTIKIQRFAGV